MRKEKETRHASPKKQKKAPKAKKTRKARRPQWVKNPAGEDVLDYHVYEMSRTERLLYAVLAFVVGGLCGLVFYGGLFKKDGSATTLTLIANAAVFVLTGIVAARLYLPIREQQLMRARQRTLRTQFRDLLESLASSMTVDTVEESFKAAYRDMAIQYTEDAWITRELREIVAAGKNEISLEVMLEDFGQRSGCEDIQDFSNVFSACRRRGGRIAQIVRQTHDIIGEKMQIEDEITSKMSSNQLELNIIMVAPVLIVGMLRLSNQTFAENFASPMGVVVITIGLGLFYLAYRMGRGIVDEVK